MTGKKRRRSRKYKILKFFVFLFALTLFFRWSNESLQVTRWEAVFPDLPEDFSGCKIVILSDLHGNLPALKAIRRDLDYSQPTGLILLGDLIDYGMQSNETVRYLQNAFP